MGPLKLGSTLSQKYRVVRLLAESGGVVLYEANDLGRKQRVWVKVLARESLTNADALEKFQLEASRATVLDVGKEGGLPYMVATELASDTDPTVPKMSPLEKSPPPRPTSKAAPPLPKAFNNPKSTLPGVAPPPAPMPRPIIAPDSEEELPPPSSSIPLLADDLIMSDPTPAPPPAPVASTPPPLPAPAIELPAPEPPVFQVPISLPPKRELMATLPPEGELVVRRDQRKPSSAKWIAAMLVLASATGAAGWYLGHVNAHPPAPPAETVTAAATATETETATATATATESATATATATESATATATATASASESATATEPEPPKPAAAPHHPPRPHPHHPPPAHTGASDPLTL